MSISVSEQELRALALRSMQKNQNKEKPKQTAEIGSEIFFNFTNLSF